MLHLAKELFFGVRVGDMKKLVKEVTRDQELARALYESGVSDAMYFARLTIDQIVCLKMTCMLWRTKHTGVQ
ncbi:DNA alkylation repair protein [Brevibacillus sp. NPDC003359]|uniref:DNA alkylation repair protein n=1 Tax=unclassified Brevibacillus TaxID=2684853 RepID=UPI0036B45AEF